MIRGFQFLLILLIITTKLSSQSISDSEFSCQDGNDCFSKAMAEEIFVKVEKDPIIEEFSKNRFDEFIKILISEINLGADQSGMLMLQPPILPDNKCK